jgi:hypothetical protein
MGIKKVPARSTLADALNLRDWRIYHALAMRLITNARELYVKKSMSADLDATVHPLDSATIDLCLSLLHWAPFFKELSAQWRWASGGAASAGRSITERQGLFHPLFGFEHQAPALTSLTLSAPLRDSHSQQPDPLDQRPGPTGRMNGKAINR